MAVRRQRRKQKLPKIQINRVSKPPKSSDEPVFSAETEKKLKTFPAAKQKNFRIKLALYERGATSQWQEKQLADAGLIDAPKDAEKTESDNDVCDTYAEIATRMMLHYQNPNKTSKLRITISKGTISDWAAGKRLDGKPLPPKPLEGVRRRWSLRAWIAWFDEHLWHDYRANANQTNGAKLAKMPIGELEEVTKRERLEHERWEIVKDMGGYIALPIAERVAAGESRKYHELWKTRNERTMIEAFEVKAQALNVAPEIIAALKDFLILEHQKFTDAVETASEKFAGEFLEKLKAEMKQETV